MPKNLVIVESPAKGKTIEGFLGKEYTVKSSFGHIRDLPEKSLAIDIEHNYQPKYVIPPDKKKIVKELEKAVAESEVIWLATDEDREGEAISWHLKEALKIPDEKYKRIVFHEITKDAIVQAIKNPRKIDMHLVNAQQARRVIDRLVGYEMSPVLWKKVKPALSAGRVQSVAVRLIVEREREIENFAEKDYFKVTGYFETPFGDSFKAELDKRFDNEQEALEFLKACQNNTFKILNVETKPAKRSPAPPFTTSTLQQEASRKLGFSVAQTMMIAQRLYEAGKITYMRTDSVNLSDLAINTAKNEIIKLFGKEYSKPRRYQTKNKSAQEAHEAIRPTYIQQSSIKGNDQEVKLYDLIWKRTLASQMADAELERTLIYVSTPFEELKFVAKGEVILFDGFLKVYVESDDHDQEEDSLELLPKIKAGEIVTVKKIDAIQRFYQHPPRYTEASLVKKLEELGIGRPSTYAPTISTIIKRGYVVKESREGHERKYKVISLENQKIIDSLKSEITGREKNKLFPTDIGKVVNDFLMEYFPEIMDYGFTAQIEKEFDIIAEGKMEWTEMVDRFYKSFHKEVEKTLETAQKTTGERLLGKDPKTGRNVYVKIGRYGPMIQMGEATDDDKPLFASLPKGVSMDDVTLEDALKWLSFPKHLGEFEKKEVLINRGKFGPYIKWGNEFISLKTVERWEELTLEKAIKIIQENQSKTSSNVIIEFPEHDIKVLKGRYGPYIKKGKKNYKLPKEYQQDPSKLTLEDCLKIIQPDK